MGKTVVNFVLPYRLIDEGDYEVSVDGKLAKIIIILEPRNMSDFTKITGLTYSASGKGKVEIRPDTRGVSSLSKVRVELPYVMKYVPSWEKIDDLESKFDRQSIKFECVKYLTRLVEVVRYTTNQYWITPPLEADIITFSCETTDDSGKSELQVVGDFGKGFDYPITMFEESSVKNRTFEMLKNEIPIPLFNDYLLDSINYFSTRRFNESVIQINIGLEAVITIYSKVKAKGKGIKLNFGKGYERFMRKQFPLIDDRSLENDTELWKKFKHARNLRWKVLHGDIVDVSPIDAYKTISDVENIIKWILQNPSK